MLPIYNEADVLPMLRQRLAEFVRTLPCPVEIVLVNDGSSDDSLRLMIDWATEDSAVKVIGLARNFGQQIALTAGLDIASGEAVVIMDSDLQDPPEVIHDMLREYRRGYDVVYAQRVSRAGETGLKRLSAWLFYRTMQALVHKQLPMDVGDFRLISRRCLDAINGMREMHRFLRGMVAWVGFPQIAVKFERPARAAGETKYPAHKLVRYAWTAAVSFSPAPLRLSFMFGALVAAGGALICVYAVVRKILGLNVSPGWASIIIVVCLVGGGILLSIGVLGEYVARIFEEVKGRPLYVVSVKSNVAGDHFIHGLNADAIDVSSRSKAEVLY